jgi:class 3 adenylate cyclase
MDPGTPLPAGTVTFRFTDIEGSTRLWEQHREAMRRAAVSRRPTHVTIEGGGESDA